MGVKMFLVNTGSISLMDQKSFRTAALAAGLEACMSKPIGSVGTDIPGLPNVGLGLSSPDAIRAARLALIQDYISKGNWPGSVDVREARPTADFGATNDRWETAALAVAGNPYTVFNGAAAPTMASNKLAVFYRVSIEDAPPPVANLVFRSGGAAGNIIGQFDLEQILNRQDTEGYFSQPVVIVPSVAFAATVTARIATNAFARMQLGCFIFEPAGQTISS